MKVRFSLAVAVCLFLVCAGVQAQTNLRLNEAETKAIFALNQLQTSIVTENPSQSFPAKIRLEVLDADDRILAQAEMRETIKRGRQTIQIALGFAQKTDASNLLWYRLRYKIAQENSSNSATGIVSLSEIMPELYELQIVAPENFYAGMRLRAHVLAVHPLTKKPIKNVNLTGEVSLDLDTDAESDELKINAAGKTNDEGYATLDFEIPQTAKLDDDGEIKIKGEKNGITREAEQDLDASTESRVYLTLDKPIYQPNQKLYVRGLFLNPARRPLADRELDLEIIDEEDETVFEKTVKTSRFGAASVEWQIPDGIKLGKYKIEIKNGGEYETIGASEFKITRYDLPNFTVEAAADKTYYLPEQKTAEVAVAATYLFGKPVAKGAVKIVRETERKWNYDEQEWETVEAKTYTGETNADGKFSAQIDLSEAHAELRGDAWKRFEDLHFAAYFTDASTNRTEVKRFDVRITKEAIHIYFIVYDSDVNPTIPFRFYVSTFYADGTPARCRVAVKGNYQEIEGEKILAESKTNLYGASRFEIRIPEKPFAEAKDRFSLQITADDKNGNVGTFADSVYLNEKEKQIRVATDKTVYLPSENIEAKIFSTEPDKTIYVDVLKNSSVVYSKRLRLEDGRGSLLIPFQRDFKGELIVAAYFKNEDGYNDAVNCSKAIIYPAADNLKLNIKSLKSVYRPNEEATVNFNVRNGAGKASETALGVAVLDKAVEERSREDRQSFDNYKDLHSLLGTTDSFGNLTRRDLNNLDSTKPVGEDLQLAAEFLLVNKSYEPRFFESDSYENDFSRIYKDYFIRQLAPVENALRNFYEKSFEPPMDEASLERILKTSGINFDDLRDAWGTPYAVEFKTDRKFITVFLKTASADKKHGTSDDFTAKEMQFQWFARTQNALSVALNNFVQQTKLAPKTTDELKTVWKQSGFDADALRDGWNRPLYLTEENYKRNAQKIVLESIGNLDGETQQVARMKVVSQETILFRLRSAGADGVRENADDFDVSSFTVVISEKPLTDEPTLAAISKTKTTNANGAVTGTLFDPNGAVVPGVLITATNQNSAEIFFATSNDEGLYLLANLPSGKYRIEAEGQHGFAQTTIENVVVSSMNLIKLDVTLQVAGATATVDVTAESTMLNTSSSSVSVTKRDADKSISARLNASGGEQKSTPRVREYFPETLLWSPDIITDKNGGATLKFKLADSLTTWKLYVVGSTETGEIGLVEKEIQTFQPFFAELDPPKILTEGDRIALPVPVRNYTDKRQKVSVSMAENNWSSLAGGATQQIEIAPNASGKATFDFRAVAPVKEGKQKITALAKGESDAIEKPVTVRPNGREIVETQSKLFRGDAEFNLNFPADSFVNTRRAELKIYPNMLAHVAESVEGLLQRPHGCGEQTTSSTYPNLMILKIERDLKKSVDAKTKQQAQNYLKEGYERLLNYQTPGGGFSYWGVTDAPNVALTAYILRFLDDAKDYIEVDERTIKAARQWLLKQQQADGSWQDRYGEPVSLTAYAARSISLDAAKIDDEKKSLRMSLEFLKKRLPEIKDAYVLANFALASINDGDTETAKIIAEKLNNLSQPDKESLRWTTAGTLFHGWGKASEIETTALVMQAFLRLNEREKFDAPISRGLAFLLKNKDRYGVWFSTQTTVNVLDALVLLQKSVAESKQNAGEKTEIYVNGKIVQTFALDANSISKPFYYDLSQYLTGTENRIEIKNSGDANYIQAQVVAAHYIPWTSAAREDSRFFDLQINFDKTEAGIGEEINCSVAIARVNYNRYGMILAEIGIPPGADVDKDSLEKATNEGISRYDVLPDKIVVYFWAGSAPTNFNFKFKPRFGINALSAPSVVYDYYNSEARATSAPVKFSIK